MKKLVILLFIYLSFAKAQAQTFTKYADTANYLIHEIKYKKSLYIGKPLSALLDGLKIKPVDAKNSISQKIGFGGVVGFYFNLENSFDKKHFITIDFENVPNYDQLFPVFYPSSGGRGTVQDIISVYKTLIVKDVSVKDYTNDEPVNPDVHY